MHKPVLLSVTLLSLISIAGFWTYSRAEGTAITACVGKNGEVYIVGQGFKNTNCSNTQTPVSWSIEGPAGPQGPAGPEGPVGAQGPAGVVSNTLIVSNSVSGGSFDSVTADASCPAGSILVSGGARVTALVGSSRAFINASYPVSTSTWRATATPVDAGAGGTTLTAYAVCASQP